MGGGGVVDMGGEFAKQIGDNMGNNLPLAEIDKRLVQTPGADNIDGMEVKGGEGGGRGGRGGEEKAMTPAQAFRAR